MDSGEKVGMHLVAEKAGETEIRKLELSEGWVFIFIF